MTRLQGYHRFQSWDNRNRVLENQPAGSPTLLPTLKDDEIVKLEFRVQDRDIGFLGAIKRHPLSSSSFLFIRFSFAYNAIALLLPTFHTLPPPHTPHNHGRVIDRLGSVIEMSSPTPCYRGGRELNFEEFGE